MASLDSKQSRNLKNSSHAMASNFEKLKKFPTKVSEGVDDCTGKVHEARFLRGYVGSSKDLWLQAREALPLEGRDAVSNYDTGSIGITGKISPQVWKEIHNPSSKELSIRMLAPSAVKSTWKSADSTNNCKDFTNMQELRVAVSTMDAAFHKVHPWNFSFKAISVFLQNMNFGEAELDKSVESVLFVADFIDEALKSNAQFWDEKRSFLSNQHLHSRWVSAMAERAYSLAAKKDTRGKNGKWEKDFNKLKGDGKGGFNGNGKNGNGGGGVPWWEKNPIGYCRNFNLGTCQFKTPQHPSTWDRTFILNHNCTQFLPEKNRFCFGDHPKFEHK